VRLVLVRSIVAALAAILIPLPAGAQEAPPQTGFEQSNGASFTTHEQELAFLAEVDAASERVTMSVIGTTAEGRPLHLVQIGSPSPHGLEAALTEPTALFVCSQHGNEPAGREACLKAIRDLAFTTDPTLLQLLSEQTFLFVPAANPDGRARNSRGNSRGTDINRDHVGLETEEGRSIAGVIRDWQPDFVMDLHEYGPSQPVVYDDDILYLWPRNLNVDRGIHDLGVSFALDHLKPCVEGAGYTADEYGLQAVGDVDVAQTAGDEDEGIMRNAMGLRHAVGILVETAVSMSTNPQQLPNEIGSTAATNRRRVASHRTVIDCTLQFLTDRGEEVRAASAFSALAKTAEGAGLNAPIYLAGADNDPPADDDILYPPPCRYELAAGDAAAVADVLNLHGIRSTTTDDGEMIVPAGQRSEPMIALLLDARGRRSIAAGTVVDGLPLSPACSPPADPDPSPSPSPTSTAIVIGAVALTTVARLRRRSD